MISTTLTRKELRRVIEIFHRGYLWWKLAEWFDSSLMAEIACIYFLACLEWCTLDAAPSLHKELHYILKEVRKLML